jgi:hypothetical protein
VAKCNEGGEIRTLDLGIKSPRIVSASIRSVPQGQVIRARFGEPDRPVPHDSASDSPQKSPQPIPGCAHD